MFCPNVNVLICELSAASPLSKGYPQLMHSSLAVDHPFRATRLSYQKGTLSDFCCGTEQCSSVRLTDPKWQRSHRGVCCPIVQRLLRYRIRGAASFVTQRLITPSSCTGTDQRDQLSSVTADCSDFGGTDLTPRSGQCHCVLNKCQRLAVDHPFAG